MIHLMTCIMTNIMINVMTAWKKSALPQRPALKKKWWWPFLGPVDLVHLATTPGGFGLDLVKPSVTCTALHCAAAQRFKQHVRT